VKTPDPPGFGPTVIRCAIPFEIGDHAEIHDRPTDLEADIFVPARLATLYAGDPRNPENTRDKAKSSAGISLPAGRILIVADSDLIASDTANTSRGLGAEEIGIPSNVRDALELIDSLDFGLARLDIGLGGGSTTVEAALKLHKRGIPFLILPAKAARRRCLSGCATCPWW
jgi:hypothetical protein